MSRLPPNYPKTEEEMKRHIERFVAEMQRSVQETKHRLLHNIDRAAVLAAARQVIRIRDQFEPDPAVFGETHSEWRFIASDDLMLPKILRDLRAGKIICLDDRLILEFGGGFHHQGLLAFAEGTAEAPTTDADKKYQRLIEDLWFYEDNH